MIHNIAIYQQFGLLYVIDGLVLAQLINGLLRIL